MKIALVLHLYQPPTQDEATIRKIFSQCYLPLIKLLKNRKSLNLTLNIPLSLLEQADKYGYTDWIADVKDLYVSERVELTGSAAYHPLLTKIPKDSLEKQIVLNEYALGYYFGSRSGFEGEPAVMTKNIVGFFAPECAVNDSVISEVSEFGYDWILVDQTAIPGANYENYESAYYSIPDVSTKIVPRNKKLSDITSFFRGGSAEDLLKEFSGAPDVVVVALDGETFGHHNTAGLDLLEDFADLVLSRGGSFCTVSNALIEMKEKILDAGDSSAGGYVLESTWGASFDEMSAGNPYPFWTGNKIQASIGTIEETLANNCQRLITNESRVAHDSSAEPVWFLDRVGSQTEDVKSYLKKMLFVLKFEHSDKYWWSSKKAILGNPMLFHRGMVEKALDFAVQAADCMEKEKEKEKFLTSVQKTLSMLES